MNAPVSSREVAARAGVSVGTVSNVQRLAYIGGPVSIRQVADRRDGALRALAAHTHRQVTFKPELEIRQSSRGTRLGA